MFIETSAKEGFNIKLLFRRLATALPSLESGGGNSEQAQVVHLTMAPPKSSEPAADGGAYSSCGC